jgi:solute:Na+ symporter, SSS family
MAAGVHPVNARTLGALQVAALLVSASYGIGFLFGSGEYALRHGMAGAIYGVATGLGMIVMATFAGRLWHAGRAVWDLLGDRCGERVRRLVALLSIVWMAGVLAAQLHGAVAVVRLLGAGVLPAYAVATGLIFVASRFELRAASIVFSACLAASAVVLVYALAKFDGVTLYAASLPAFTQALPSLGLAQNVTIGIGVGLLVCTGADYHQFVLAARDPRSAVRGCLLAGVALLLLAFLPPAVVLATAADPQWPGVTDPKQVVPQALSVAARSLSAAAGPLMLAMLGIAALGSGAAILRAMVSALQSAQARHAAARPAALAGVALGLATALTASGLPIVDTMVSVNVVYIASVGVSLVGLLRGTEARGVDDTWVIAAGFAAAVAVYLAAGLGVPIPNVELVALVAGLATATAARVALRRRERDLACEPANR